MKVEITVNFFQLMELQWALMKYGGDDVPVTGNKYHVYPNPLETCNYQARPHQSWRSKLASLPIYLHGCDCSLSQYVTDYLKLVGTVDLPKFMHMPFIILICPLYKIQKSTKSFLPAPLQALCIFLASRSASKPCERCLWLNWED